MAVAVYVLCAVTSAVCAILLTRSWRENRVALLFWSALCFAGLAINNLLLFVDKVIVTGVDLSLARSLSALIAVSVLVYGLIWEAR
jgi:hypothetical protein